MRNPRAELVKSSLPGTAVALFAAAAFVMSTLRAAVIRIPWFIVLWGAVLPWVGSLTRPRTQAPLHPEVWKAGEPCWPVTQSAWVKIRFVLTARTWSTWYHCVPAGLSFG